MDVEHQAGHQAEQQIEHRPFPTSREREIGGDEMIYSSIQTMFHLVPRRQAVLHKAILGRQTPDGYPSRAAFSPISHHGTRRRAGAIRQELVQVGHAIALALRPEISRGLQGAPHTGLQLIIHRSHEVLEAPGGRGLNKTALHDRLLPTVHHIDIRLLLGGEEAISHHRMISTPSLITN